MESVSMCVAYSCEKILSEGDILTDNPWRIEDYEKGAMCLSDTAEKNMLSLAFLPVLIIFGLQILFW